LPGHEADQSLPSTADVNSEQTAAPLWLYGSTGATLPLIMISDSHSGVTGDRSLLIGKQLLMFKGSLCL